MTASPGSSGTGGGITDVGSTESPGSFASYTTPPLRRSTDVVGVPDLLVHLDAPTFAQTQKLGAGGKLVLFVKLEDVDPATNSVVLPDDVIAAVRVPDVNKPLRVQLQGIVHRFARGHELRLTIATGDIAYKGNDYAGLVGVPVAPNARATLAVPVLGKQTGRTGSGPDGTTPFG